MLRKGSRDDGSTLDTAGPAMETDAALAGSTVTSTVETMESAGACCVMVAAKLYRPGGSKLGASVHEHDVLVDAARVGTIVAHED